MLWRKVLLVVPEVSHPLLPWSVNKRSTTANKATELQGGPWGLSATLPGTELKRRESLSLLTVRGENEGTKGHHARERGSMTYGTVLAEGAEPSRAEPQLSSTVRCRELPSSPHHPLIFIMKGT